MEINKTYLGDSLEVLKTFPDNSIDCCVTSPPYYGLRDYGNDKQIGLEKTPEEYIEKLRLVFAEVKRVLKKDGTLWLNIGDSYNGSGGDHKQNGKNDASFQSGLIRGDKEKIVPGLKPKDLIGIPWMLAFALRSDRWWLRQDIIWHKPNPMPESVTDRCTKAHEYIFLMSKSAKYYFDNDAIKTESIWAGDPRAGYGRLHYRGKRQGEDGTGQENFVSITEKANKRSVWTENTKAYSEAHFATFPELLIEDCVKAGCRKDGIVLDPFSGAGTTSIVAKKLGRKFVGIELNPDYIKLTNERMYDEFGMFLNENC